jgi:N6-adenosine-specific RNA methylase IME4
MVKDPYPVADANREVVWPPLPTEKYPVIVCDPPWAYANWSDKAHGAARSWYECLTNKQIAELPVGDVVADNAALVMWITGPKLVEGAHLPIMKAWGFRPVTMPWVWHKTTKDGGRYTGLGFYTRSECEFVVLGIRGKYPRKEGATKVMQHFDSPRRLHSQKPETFPCLVRSLFDGPYLELFAREEATYGGADWHIWGNEVPELQGVTNEL